MKQEVLESQGRGKELRTLELEIGQYSPTPAFLNDALGTDLAENVKELYGAQYRFVRKEMPKFLKNQELARVQPDGSKSFRCLEKGCKKTFPQSERERHAIFHAFDYSPILIDPAGRSHVLQSEIMRKLETYGHLKNLGNDRLTHRLEKEPNYSKQGNNQIVVSEQAARLFQRAFATESAKLWYELPVAKVATQLAQLAKSLGEEGEKVTLGDLLVERIAGKIKRR